MYVCMYGCMYVLMYVCMHVCMHACMRACMYVYNRNAQKCPSLQGIEAWDIAWDCMKQANYK